MIAARQRCRGARAAALALSALFALLVALVTGVPLAPARASPRLGARPERRRLLHGAHLVSPTSCPRNVADSLPSAAGHDQLVVVEAADLAAITASVSVWQRVGSCFASAGGPWPAEAGRNGFSADRREGDGTTPIGAFSIGPVMYGIAPNPGVAYPYRQLVCGDWWDEDASSPEYNRFVHVACGATPGFADASEALWTEAPDYDELAVIDYNVDPTVPGRGSGIFLHDSTGISTSGCIALEPAPLLEVLRWLRPGDRPLVVVAPRSALLPVP